MPTIQSLRMKYAGHKAIQCICDAFDCQNHTIAINRGSSDQKVLHSLMWNRGVHLILAGDIVRTYSRAENEIWKDVIQIAIDADVFSKDAVMTVNTVKETENGLLVSFDSPVKKSQESSFKKKLIKIQKIFSDYDSWGNSVLTPFTESV